MEGYRRALVALGFYRGVRALGRLLSGVPGPLGAFGFCGGSVRWVGICRGVAVHFLACATTHIGFTRFRAGDSQMHLTSQRWINPHRFDEASRR